ncbi:MAG: esterase/lipase family protein [Methylovulum sp.]
MDIILIHGMGRTPVSMLLLSHRFKKLGYKTYLFGYFPAFESLEQATDRLLQLIDHKIGEKQFAVVGHSLGSVIIRNAINKRKQHQLSACFFLAPPMVACKAAKFFSRFRLYRLITGEMGQLLAQERFMNQLPSPENTRIYVGTGGPRAAWLPFGLSLNDGILSVEEASGKTGAVVLEVPSTHTFIMNSRVVFNDINCSLKSLS